MDNVELMKIALKHIEKGYSSEQMTYGDDLYSATVEEVDKAVDYYFECQRVGTATFLNMIEEEKAK